MVYHTKEKKTILNNEPAASKISIRAIDTMQGGYTVTIYYGTYSRPKILVFAGITGEYLHAAIKLYYKSKNRKIGPQKDTSF